MMTEGFALVNIRKMNLDLASRKQGQRIAKRHRTMCQSSRVDQNPVCLVDRLMDGGDYFCLAVRLHPVKRDVLAPADSAAAGLYIAQRVGAVNLGLACAKHVQVWPVDHEDVHRFRHE